MSAGYSRRGFFTAFAEAFQAKGCPEPRAVAPATLETAAPAEARIAIIQGRFCIALTSFCAVCVERCPVPGAITRQQGLPMAHADVCTGCGICHDVCPAPRNAVLMLPRRPSLPAA